MSRILYWSDLHDEFWSGLPLSGELPEVDAILVGGDLSTRGRHVDRLVEIQSAFAAPVFMVRGNHEYYGSCREDLIAEEGERLAKLRSDGVDIRVLDRDVVHVGETRILGATLWTDLVLYPGHEDLIRRSVMRGMNDFSLISVRDEPRGRTRRLSPEDWLAMHAADRDFLLEELARPHPGPTVVMTHHMPCRELIHPMRERSFDPVNAGFASDLWPLFQGFKIDAWLYGHSHDGVRLTLDGAHGTVPFIANPRGYPREGAVFDPVFTLDFPQTGPGPRPE